MKKVILYLIVFVSTSALGQEYVLSKKYEPFKQYSTYDTISVPNWDDPRILVPLNFNFKILGEEHDTVWVGDGQLGFGCVFVGALSSCDKYIDVFNCDFIDRFKLNKNQKSYILIRKDSTLLVEWQNVGFFGEYDVLNSLNDSITLQVILGRDNSITMHIGNYKISDTDIDYSGNTGAYFGVWNNRNYKESYMIGGPPDQPSIFEGDIDVSLGGTPLPNTIYKLSPYTGEVSAINHVEPILISRTSRNTVSLTNTSNSPVTIDFFDISGKQLQDPIKLESKEMVSYSGNSSSSIILVRVLKDSKSKIYKIVFQ